MIVIIVKLRAAPNTHPLTLIGAVKNESNNSVILVANGNKQDIEKLINWCKHGPKFARVNKIEVVWEKPKKDFKNFNFKF